MTTKRKNGKTTSSKQSKGSYRTVEKVPSRLSSRKANRTIKTSKKSSTKRLKEAKRGGKKLDLSFSEIDELPNEIKGLQELEIMDLSGNELNDLPVWFSGLKRLRTLSLTGNRFESIPDSVCKLGQLQNLSISNNQLSEIPDGLGKMKKLRSLNLSDNELSDLPQAIGKLSRLERLFLERNKFKEIPTSLRALDNLKSLKLNGNYIKTISSWIGELAKLEILEVRDNFLSGLPDTIVLLKNLQSLRLKGNELESLPHSVAEMSSLLRLELDTTKFDSALQSACNAGLESLRSYLKSVSNPKLTEKLFEAKLILVGDGEVGKTTLLKALTGQTTRGDEASTHGVEVALQHLPINHPGYKNVTIHLNSWDFGGQEVYKPTHQFFFSPNSIYLLVWKPRRGVQQSGVEEWLRLIRQRVGMEGQARAIVVSTHCKDGRHPHIEQKSLKKKFPMIYAFHAVDSIYCDPETGEYVGIAKLKELIAEAATDLDLMGMPFNHDWRAARDELLSLDVPCITFDRFAQICSKFNIDTAESRNFASVLHELGHVVYYGDDEDLKEDVILKPEWLAKAIGSVLEDSETEESDGVLPDSRLKEIWSGNQLDGAVYDRKYYPFFLRLMEKFDVSYRLTGSRRRASLIAQLVPEVAPKALPWVPDGFLERDSEQISMVCCMREAVPPGLVPWMIVRTHGYSKSILDQDGNEHLLHWQRGMFLEYENYGQAYLELVDRELQIHVRGPFPTPFFWNLYLTLEKLIQDKWKGLKDRYYFALPCPTVEGGAPCEGRYNLETLRNLQAKNIEKALCYECCQDNDIAKMLYNLEPKDTAKELEKIRSMLGEELVKLDDRIRGLLNSAVISILRGIANDSRNWPRLFTIRPLKGHWAKLTNEYELQLWCESPECQHPVLEEGKGKYVFKQSKEWLDKILPYATKLAQVLYLVAPILSTYTGTPQTMKTPDIEILSKSINGLLEYGRSNIDMDIASKEGSQPWQSIYNETEREALLTFHSLLKKIDPQKKSLGLRPHAMHTGDYMWLCDDHYNKAQSKIPSTFD